jgi:hypothetical protein
MINLVDVESGAPPSVVRHVSRARLRALVALLLVFFVALRWITQRRSSDAEF